MKTMTKTPPTPADLAAAAVAAAEARLGADNFGSAACAAAVAAGEVRRSGAGAMFVTAVAAVFAAVVNHLEWLTRSFPSGPAYGVAMASLHRDALLAGNADLAALIRSPQVAADVGAQAATMAPALARPAAELAAEAIGAFELEIARQLEGSDGHPLQAAARDYIAATELLARVVAARARHETALAERDAAAKAERLAAERAAEEAEEARAREIEEAALKAVHDAEQLRFASLKVANARLARRLDRTKATRLEIGRQIYDPKEVARTAAHGGWSAVQIQVFEGALNAAEAGALQ